MTHLNSNSRSPAARRSHDRLEQLRRMIEIRGVENRIQKLFAEGQVRGSTHLANGQEAVAVGIARAIDPDDVVTCTYRGHGHALALGVTPAGVIGEICGRTDRLRRRARRLDAPVEPSVGLLPTVAIVGAGLPIACGAAMAARARGNDRVAVADLRRRLGEHRRLSRSAEFRGDPEAAGGLRLREQSLRRIHPHQSDDAGRGHRHPRRRATTCPGVIVDGQDVDTVAEAMARRLRAPARATGPRSLEMKTYRYSGHSRSDPATYRPAGELDAWLKRDPINLFARQLAGEGLFAEAGLDALRKEIVGQVEGATAEALAAPQPAEIEILSHVTKASPGGDARWNFWSR